MHIVIECLPRMIQFCLYQKMDTLSVQSTLALRAFGHAEIQQPQRQKLRRQPKTYLDDCSRRFP